MSVSWTLRRGAVGGMLLVAMPCQGTQALAGTTGGLSGTVTDDKGAPVAGAAVKAVSPSETVAQTTDASGHFRFLSLAADTYTVAITKDGFNPNSYTGVTVFADQNLALSFKLTPVLHVIAITSSRSAGNLVSSRVSDVYAVSAAQQNAVSGIGRGYNLTAPTRGFTRSPECRARSEIRAFGQVFYIRGSAHSEVGDEFDGVPVNRAFDSYNANSVSNIGTQQTEVYTGGILLLVKISFDARRIPLNEVIKTGTYPGTADVVGGIGSPTFDHNLISKRVARRPTACLVGTPGCAGRITTYPIVNSQNGDNLASDGSNQWGIAGVQQNSTVFGLQPIRRQSGVRGRRVNAAARRRRADSPITCSTRLGRRSRSTSPCARTILRSGWRCCVPAIHGRPGERGQRPFRNLHHRDGGKDDVQVLFDNFGYLSAIFRLDKRKRRSLRRPRTPQRTTTAARRASRKGSSVLPAIPVRADPTTISVRSMRYSALDARPAAARPCRIWIVKSSLLEPPSVRTRGLPP